jgi:hypothetical protein
MKQMRTFGTMSDDLQQLSDWLAEQRVTLCGDGEHGQLLETDLQCAGGAVRVAVGQRTALSTPAA